MTDYEAISARIDALVEGVEDEVARMATVVCELHHSVRRFHWTGFYRVTAPDTLTVGPYQGTHGCLTIPFSRGVCGAAARTGQTQVVEDVEAFPGHIACSSSTRSEIVVPVFGADGALVAVLDIDSDDPAAFDETDARALEAICARVFGQDPSPPPE